MNQDYSYNYTQFYGKKNVVFTLIGTRSERINSTLMNTIDEFVSINGDYCELKRSAILEQVENGKMQPVLESEIKVKSVDSKSWEKIKGRNI